MFDEKTKPGADAPGYNHKTGTYPKFVRCCLQILMHSLKLHLVTTCRLYHGLYFTAKNFRSGLGTRGFGWHQKREITTLPLDTFDPYLPTVKLDHRFRNR